MEDEFYFTDDTIPFYILNDIKTFSNELFEEYISESRRKYIKDKLIFALEKDDMELKRTYHNGGKSDQTIYIYTDPPCTHKMSKVTAEIEKIEIEVEFCRKCKKYFISEEKYLEYREKFGVIYGNMKYINPGKYSALYIFGYFEKGADRQTAISKCIQWQSANRAELFEDLCSLWKEKIMSGSDIAADIRFLLDFNIWKKYYSSNHYNLTHLFNVQTIRENRFKGHSIWDMI